MISLLWSLPLLSIKTASPGNMSRSNTNPRASSATLSEATILSNPAPVFLDPTTKGRIPFGSRKATIP